jgi:acetyl-CoA carboxylase carboxyl transferase subunit beta
MAQSPRTASAKASPAPRRKVQTEGKWRKCENAACSQSLFIGDVEKNLYCCKYCGHHFRMGARQRLEATLDPDSWVELFTGLETEDPLKFKALRPYHERVRDAQARSGLKEAILCAEGRLEGHRLVCGAMDFQFIGASMGSVVGEKVSRSLEYATQRGLPVVVFCCSGGARMDEGALSLMQMAKTSAAVNRHHEAGLPYLTVLTDPTLAGVSASFAFLADVILAEPKAMIGFTGARVIEQTLKVKLPEGFQEAEFLLEHGQIDKVVPRKELRPILARLLDYLTPPGETPAAGEPAERAAPARSRAADRRPARRKRR